MCDYKVKECEMFTNDWRMLQYFNCQQYKHIRKWCRTSAVCGKCAGGHGALEYNPETTGQQQEVRSVWEEDIPHGPRNAKSERRKGRERDRERADRERTNRPRTYAVEGPAVNRARDQHQYQNQLQQEFKDQMKEVAKGVWTAVAQEKDGYISTTTKE